MAELNVTPGGERRRFLTFRVAERLYALPSDGVSEVIRTPAAARVPQAPKSLLGVANLRGDILPLVSVRGLISLSEAPSDSGSRAIVLSGDAPVALNVDAVDALVESDRVEQQQSEIAAADGEILMGAFETSSGVARILDIRALLETEFAARARVRRRAQPAAAPVSTGDVVEDIDMLLTFNVAGQEFALRLDVVQEIVPLPQVTHIPRAEELVLGMMAFRDKLLPLISLRGLLGFASACEWSGRENVIVLRLGSVLVGLVADSAHAVVRAERGRIDPIPAVLAARTGGESKIESVYRGTDRLISILAPGQIFREDVMRRLPAHNAQLGVTSLNSGIGANDERLFLVFRLGADEFAVPIDAVDEVARVPEQITRVPKTPDFLEGIINLRGDVLPVLDQRKRFDLPEMERTHKRRLIVLRTDRYRAAVIVDSVREVLRCSETVIDPAPELTEGMSRLLHGVINLEEQKRIVLLLEPAELLTQAERGLLDAFAPGMGQATA